MSEDASYYYYSFENDNAFGSALSDPDYQDLDTYNTSVVIHSYYRVLFKAGSVVDVIMCLLYVYVFVHDRFCKAKLLNLSYFIIQLVPCAFNAYQGTVFVFRAIDLTSRAKKELYLEREAPIVIIVLQSAVTWLAYSRERVITAFELLIAFNRFSATVFPASYKRIWSNRHTVWVCALTTFFCTAVAGFELFLNIYSNYTDRDRLFASSFIYFSFCICPFLSFLVVVTSSVVSSKKFQKKSDSVAQKADKKLLKMTVVLNSILFVVAINDILYLYLPSEKYLMFGVLFNNYFVCSIALARFATTGGAIILLLFNSSVMRKAYARTPGFREIKNWAVVCFYRIIGQKNNKISASISTVSRSGQKCVLKNQLFKNL